MTHLRHLLLVIITAAFCGYSFSLLAHHQMPKKCVQISWIFVAKSPDKEGLLDHIGERGQLITKDDAEAHPYKGGVLSAEKEVEARQAAFFALYHQPADIYAIPLK